ncbi:MAG: sirohydrochlorin chelatase [Rhodoferax sp.]
MTTPAHTDRQRGTILLAHGSRDPLWRRPIEAVAERVRQLAPALHVRCAYLEATAPDLAACVAELAGLGVLSITVMPLLLGMGKHARDDLPILLATLQQNHPGIVFVLKPAIGEQSQMIELMAHIALA